MYVDVPSSGIMRAATVVLILVAPVNLATNVFLVYHTPLDARGSMLGLCCEALPSVDA